jgi:hypothetical protein
VYRPHAGHVRHCRGHIASDILHDGPILAIGQNFRVLIRIAHGDLFVITGDVPPRAGHRRVWGHRASGLRHLWLPENVIRVIIIVLLWVTQRPVGLQLRLGLRFEHIQCFILELLFIRALVGFDFVPIIPVREIPSGFYFLFITLKVTMVWRVPGQNIDCSLSRSVPPGRAGIVCAVFSIRPRLVVGTLTNALDVSKRHSTNIFVPVPSGVRRGFFVKRVVRNSGVLALSKVVVVRRVVGVVVRRVVGGVVRRVVGL